MDNDDIREIITIDDWPYDLSELTLNDRMLSPETAALVQQSLGSPFFSDDNDDVVIIGEFAPQLDEEVNVIDNDLMLIPSNSRSVESEALHQSENYSSLDEQTVLTIGQSVVNNNNSNNSSSRRVVIRNNRSASNVNENADPDPLNNYNNEIQYSVPYQHDSFSQPGPGPSNRRRGRTRNHRMYHGPMPNRRLIINGYPIPADSSLDIPNSVDNLSYEDLVELSDSVQLQPGQGMSRSAIKQHTLTSMFSPETDTSPDKSCCICLIDFEAHRRVRTLPCFHRFHVKCIDDWLVRKAECPVCRVDVASVHLL